MTDGNKINLAGLTLSGLTCLFEDLGEQTKMTFSVAHKTEEYRQQQEEMGFRNGWGSTFDRLEEYLKEK